MKTLKKLILALILGSSLFIASCTDTAALGIGRREYFDYIPPVEFSMAEKMKLMPLKEQEPDLVAKIELVHKQWTGMLAERRALMERAIDINRTQMIEAKYTKDEANQMIRACLMQHGWPTDDPLMKMVQ